jgi:hypothetical protein
MKAKRGQRSTSPKQRRRARRETAYISDQPADRDQPGSGGPGDEVTAPPEVKEIQELAESAVETGFAQPPQPSEPPPHEEAKPEPAELAEWHAEVELDHAGLENEEEEE